jgi:hypothetical protein
MLFGRLVILGECILFLRASQECFYLTDGGCALLHGTYVPTIYIPQITPSQSLLSFVRHLASWQSGTPEVYAESSTMGETYIGLMD